MKDLLNILISNKANKLINTEEYMFEATKDEMEGLEMNVKFPLVDMEANVYQCRVRDFHWSSLFLSFYLNQPLLSTSVDFFLSFLS